MNNKIYVAGHNGMVGSALVKTLIAQGQTNIVVRTRAELDLTDQSAVKQFFEEERPDQVYIAAAKVGGINANQKYPAEFMYDNIMIETNIIHQAWKTGVHKLLFLGSGCIYPKIAPQPMSEHALLSSWLEPTNEQYAIAKITGIKLCESYNRQYNVDYRSIMPTNLYGPGDNYNLENSHVIPALIRKFHEAKINNLPVVTVWGSGNARREFLFVDDMALASVQIMNLDSAIYNNNLNPMESHINVGTGTDVTINELAHTIKTIVEYTGEIQFDNSKPDGVPQRLLNSDKITALGFKPTINLTDGLLKAYDAFKLKYDC